MPGTWRPRRAGWMSVTGVSVAFACQVTCLYGFLRWAPQFFVRAHRWTAGRAGIWVLSSRLAAARAFTYVAPFRIDGCTTAFLMPRSGRSFLRTSIAINQCLM